MRQQTVITDPCRKIDCPRLDHWLTLQRYVGCPEAICLRNRARFWNNCVCNCLRELSVGYAGLLVDDGLYLVDKPGK